MRSSANSSQQTGRGDPLVALARSGSSGMQVEVGSMRPPDIPLPSGLAPNSKLSKGASNNAGSASKNTPAAPDSGVTTSPSIHAHSDSDIPVNRLSPQYLLQCFRQFKEVGKIGPHLARPLLTLLPAPSEERRSVEPVILEEGSVSFGSNRPLHRWDSGSPSEAMSGLLSRPIEPSLGRGRPRVDPDNPSSPATATARSKGPRPPGMSSLGGDKSSAEELPSGEGSRTSADGERADASQAMQRAAASRGADNVPLWRRKDRSGSDGVEAPPGSAFAGLPSTSFPEPSSKPLSRAEPGQAGFLLSRADSRGLPAPGFNCSLPLAGISNPHPASLGKLAPVPDRRQRAKLEEEKAAALKPGGCLGSPRFHVAQPGKFGVRDANWVEDDWSTVRGKGAPGDSSKASPQADEWLDQPRDLPPSPSEEADRWESLKRGGMNERGPQKDWKRFPEGAEQSPWASRAGSKEDIKSTTWNSNVQNSRGFWDASPVVHKQGETARRDAPRDIGARDMPNHQPLDLGSVPVPLRVPPAVSPPSSFDIADERSLLGPLSSDYRRRDVFSSRQPVDLQFGSSALLGQFRPDRIHDRVHDRLGDPVYPPLHPISAPSIADPLIDSLISGTPPLSHGAWEEPVDAGSSMIDHIIGRVVNSNSNKYEPAAPVQHRLDSVLQSLLGRESSSARMAAMDRLDPRDYSDTRYGGLLGRERNIGAQPLQYPNMPLTPLHDYPGTRMSNTARGFEDNLNDREIRTQAPRDARVPLPLDPVVIDPVATGSTRGESAWRSRDSEFDATQTSTKQLQHAPPNLEMLPPQPERPLGPISLTDAVWEYRDPKGQLQGCFTSNQMQAWAERNFLPLDLLMRYSPQHPWKQFCELFPPPLADSFPAFSGFPTVDSDGHVSHPCWPLQQEPQQEQQEPQQEQQQPPQQNENSAVHEPKSAWHKEQPVPESKAEEPDTDTRASALTTGLKSMLGMATPSSRADSVGRTATQQKQPAPTAPFAPNPMAGISVPPTRKTDAKPQQPAVERKPAMPVKAREPVPDLLEVMQEQENEAAREAEVRNKVASSQMEEPSIKGKPAWKTATAPKPSSSFDESDFPDPASLFQTDAKRGKQSKSDLTSLPVKGAKKSPFQQFFEVEAKPNSQKSVWKQPSLPQPSTCDFTAEIPVVAKPAPVVPKTVAPVVKPEPKVEVADASWLTVSRKMPETAAVGAKKVATQPAQPQKPAPKAVPAKAQKPIPEPLVESQQEIDSSSAAEMVEIHKLIKSCKLQLDDTMVEFLKGFKTAAEIVDLLKDSLQDRSQLQLFATEFVAICQNPFRTVSYNKGSTGSFPVTNSWKTISRPAVQPKPITIPQPAVKAVRAEPVAAPRVVATPAKPDCVAKPVSKPVQDTVVSEEESSTQPKSATKGKRAKKSGKGKVVDPSLLGFSVKSNRIMQGAIDYGD